MDNDLLAEAINLTLFGMGFVFVFLTLMVLVTTVMSLLVKRFQPNLNLATTSNIEFSSDIDHINFCLGLIGLAPLFGD